MGFFNRWASDPHLRRRCEGEARLHFVPRTRANRGGGTTADLALTSKRKRITAEMALTSKRHEHERNMSEKEKKEKEKEKVSHEKKLR